MQVTGITCSGVDEKNAIAETVAFLKKFPKVELGIQCYAKDFGKRCLWLENLFKACDTESIQPFISLHLNEEYAQKFCENQLKEIPIYDLLQSKNKSGNSRISRIQINFVSNPSSSYPNVSPDIEKLKKQVEAIAHQRIILPYSMESKNVIMSLHTQIPFDILFDESFGSGKVGPRHPPLFPDVYQGYAGGLGPENIQEELEKISKLTQQDIFVDAEGKLKEQGIFSFQKAEKFVSRILQFNLDTMRDVC